MNWRVDLRKMIGRKAEPIVVLEVNDEELAQIAAGNPGTDLGLDLLAAHAALEADIAERKRG